MDAQMGVGIGREGGTTRVEGVEDEERTAQEEATNNKRRRKEARWRFWSLEGEDDELRAVQLCQGS